MTAWRKSSYSGGGGGTTDCLEVARLSSIGEARDVKAALDDTAE